MEMHHCRFCNKKDRILYSFELRVKGKTITTFVCSDCMLLLKEDLVTIVHCMYCGNLYFREEPSRGTMILLPYCGICERSGQVLKGVSDEKEKTSQDS